MIVVNLDVMMAKRKIGLGELAEKVDITRAVRFSTLDALCRALDCQPGDILAWEPDKEEYDGF